MKNIKEIVGENLQLLRKERKLTQLEVAEIFGYSDKAISKWENGDTLPDLETLYRISLFYGVTLDFLIQEGDEKTREQFRIKTSNKISIVCLLVSLIWMIATIIFVWLGLINDIWPWQVFAWSVPVSCLLLLYLNHLWGRRVYIFYIMTVLIWSLITSCYLQFLAYNLWPLFILGIPAQISLLLWVGIKDSIFHKKEKQQKLN